MSLISRRFLSSTVAPIVSRSPPPKSHHHGFIPSSSFPKGFVVGGTHAGIKKVDSALDLGILYSEVPRTAAAASFTKNAFKAAPVLVSDEILTNNRGYARALVVNSGCANAVTGKQGLENAWRMSRETDQLFVSQDKLDSEALVMSTGVIGVNLDIGKVIRSIRSFQPKSISTNSLGADFSSWERFAKAFMTTDTFPKLRSRVFTIRGIEYRMAGVDKGAGMIHPDMGPASTPFSSASTRHLHATLLACIATDAIVSPRSLQSALTYAVDRSFNSISVDGDMSTNDSVYIFANGAAVPTENQQDHLIDEEKDAESYQIFRSVLTDFAQDLAKLVVRDGEGATKFVTVTVKVSILSLSSVYSYKSFVFQGAPTHRDAHNIASRISTSALVKTALYGEDANWGRILAATGSVPLLPSSSIHSDSHPTIDPTKVSVTFIPSDSSTPLPVLVDGEPKVVDEARALEILRNEEFELEVDLGLGGQSEAKYWTCDFSYVSSLSVSWNHR